MRSPVELQFHDGEFEIVDWILFHNCTSVRGCYPNASTKVQQFLLSCTKKTSASCEVDVEHVNRIVGSLLIINDFFPPLPFREHCHLL